LARVFIGMPQCTFLDALWCMQSASTSRIANLSSRKTPARLSGIAKSAGVCAWNAPG
jgi:hypothetical protein